MTGRYITERLLGIGGEIKAQPEDFLVEELALYEPCGQGEHTYVGIEKRSLSTLEAVQALARALHIPDRDIGYAGIKDAQAIARQTLSLLHVEPEEVEQLHLPDIEVLWVSRHRNKLHIGHLRGNRFTIRIRGVGPSALLLARPILDLLRQRGVPNHYGPQRFGERGNSHLLGRALLHLDAPAFLAELLGRPSTGDGDTVREARRRYEAGDWATALQMWPSGMAYERQALQVLIERKDAAQAMYSLSLRFRSLLLSAYQSHLFNQVMAARLGEMDRIHQGDLAWKHDNGTVFLVDHAEREQPRADRFEISPSGPIFGYQARLAQAEPGRLERQILEAEGLQLEDFRRPRGLKAEGARRPLRVPLGEVNVWYDEGLMLRFALPSGSYATNVLGEVMKADAKHASANS